MGEKRNYGKLKRERKTGRKQKETEMKEEKGVEKMENLNG